MDIKRSFLLSNNENGDGIIITVIDNIQCSIRSYDKIGTRINKIIIKGYRGGKINEMHNGNEWIVELSEPIYAPVSGQQAVFYWDNLCIGGGIITNYCSKINLLTKEK